MNLMKGKCNIDTCMYTFIPRYLHTIIFSLYIVHYFADRFMKEIKRIKTLEEFEDLKKTAINNSELMLFKYSPNCTISFVGEKLFDRWFSGLSEDTNIICAKIDVLAARPLSRHIAGELDIKHESPQMIWLNKEGKVKWHGSHHRITERTLEENLMLK